tara:strand:+ start:314 stop:553 length:240 start_codon:yes stop_codon:yes gene_type:complete
MANDYEILISHTMRKDIKKINKKLDIIWQSFPYPKLVGKSSMIDMLQNIETNARIIREMLEEMGYESPSFKTEGVRNDK